MHAVARVSFLNPFLSGPAGFPRECFSLIGTGLTGHPALGALDFHPWKSTRPEKFTRRL